MVKKLLRLFFIIYLFIAMPALADFSVSDWKYFKTIGVSRPGLQKLQLDKEAFSSLSKDLRDLRVIADNSEEVPYKIVIEEERQISDRFSFQLKILNNAYTAGPQLAPSQNGQQPTVLGFQQFIVDFGPRLETPTHNYIEIHTTERNFQKQVEISGSDDGENWQLIKSDGYIYDYTDTRVNFHAQNTVIHYPLSTFQFLRVRIFSNTPFGVNGAQVYKFVKEEAKETTFDVRITQENDIKTGYTNITLDLGQDGLPTSELQLFTNDTNFDRPLFLSGFGSDPSKIPQEAVGLGNGYIFRYNTFAPRGENLSIPYSESSFRYIMVSIFNGDDKPLEFTGAKVKGILRSIVFEAQEGKSYRLYYGNVNARRAIYDIERRFPYINVSSASSAQLGAQKDNSSFEKPKIPISERYSFLLPMALILVSIFLLFLVYRFMKHVR